MFGGVYMIKVGCDFDEYKAGLYFCEVAVECRYIFSCKNSCRPLTLGGKIKKNLPLSLVQHLNRCFFFFSYLLKYSFLCLQGVSPIEGHVFICQWP